MAGVTRSFPRLFGLFQKRIQGDDALLELAQFRFRRSGLLPEYHAGDVAERNRMERFHPAPERAGVLHLPRGLDLFRRDTREYIAHIGTAGTGSLLGMVVHDQEEIRHDFGGYREALADLNRRLEGADTLKLFVEYAVGLDPELYCRTIEAAADLSAITACIDIGHVGIRQARHCYEQRFPGRRLDAAETGSQGILERMPAVQEAVRAGCPAVVEMISRLAALEKPVHFHLHDGHPLVENQYGVPDHRSFLHRPVVHIGRESTRLEPLFGRRGIALILDAVRRSFPTDAVSLTLEIHETLEREALDNESLPLFSHWRDKTNAEKMNHWLLLLAANANLLRSQG